MPIVHVEELTGDDAFKWLPLARSELRKWDQFYECGGVRFKVIPLPDGYIRMRQVDELQYIAINVGGGAYFEFFTSGYPVFTQTITSADGLFTYEAYKAAVVGATMRLAKDADGGDRIVLSPAASNRSAVSGGSAVGRAFQGNLIDEPVGYLQQQASGVYQRALYESWAPGHSFTALGMTAHNNDGDWQFAGQTFWRDRGSYSSQIQRDVGFDIPFEYSDGRKQVTSGTLNDGVVDWPRANGIQSVTSEEFGTRVFALYMDAFNQLSAFPLSEIGDENGIEQNVPLDAVQRASGFLPAWVHQPEARFIDTVAQAIVDDSNEAYFQPEIDWKFNHVGTKACAVVVERTEALYDSAYFAAYPFNFNGTDPFAGGVAAIGLPSRVGASSFAGVEQLYMYGSGLVRIDIKITLTGPDAKDFTLEVVGTELRRPTTATLCTFMAGYVWHDIKAPDWTIEVPTYLCRAGDLLTLDIERWYEPTPVVVDPTWDFHHLIESPMAGYLATGEVLSFFSLKVDEVEVRTLPGATLLACDFKTASFVVGLRDHETVVHAVPISVSNPPIPETFDLDHVVTHPAAAVFTQGVLREVFFAEGEDETVRARLQAQAEADPRDDVAGFTFLPLNDLRDWSSSAELTILRDLTTAGFGFSSITAGSRDDLSATTLNWWVHGMRAQGTNAFLSALSNPSFGWALYMHEINNRLLVTPHTTFFTHPNGTWAFFDQQHLYNKHGIPDLYRTFTPEIAQEYVFLNDVPGNYFIDAAAMQLVGFHAFPTYVDENIDWEVKDLYNTLGPLSASDFEHVIYDRIHFVMPNGDQTIMRDSSFLELYNAAIVNRAATDDELANFTALTVDDLRATFAKASYAGGALLRLQVDWQGQRWNLYDSLFSNGFGSASVAGASAFPTLCHEFYSHPTIPTSARSVPMDSLVIRFSSCLALGL